jgi:hypothetical protein
MLILKKIHMLMELLLQDNLKQMRIVDYLNVELMVILK